MNTSNMSNDNNNSINEESVMVRMDIAEEFEGYECGLDTYEDDDGNMRPQGFHYQRPEKESTFLYIPGMSEEENILNNMELDEDTFLHCMEISGLIKEDLRDIEDELYQDELDYQLTDNKEELAEEIDSFRSIQSRFNQLLDLQERLDKGMGMIKQATIDYEKVKDNYHYLKTTSAPWEVRNEAYNLYGQAFKYRAKLWEHWNRLRGLVQEVVGEDKILWVWFFQLQEMEMPTYWTTADAEDIDDQIDLWNGGREHTQCMLDNEDDPRVYEGDIFEDIQMELAKRVLNARPTNRVNTLEEDYMDSFMNSLF